MIIGGPSMNYQRSTHRVAILLIALLSCFWTLSGRAQQKPGGIAIAGQDVTILVTVHPHDDRARAAAAKLQPEDFTVLEEKRKQRILSVKPPTEAPPIIAVLIQDDLVSRVNNEIQSLKEFIRRLPEGSRVMTGYVTAGSLRVTQDFTLDRTRAADSL